MQARWLAWPSTLTRHSWQTPMPQNRPRHSPPRVVRIAAMPCAASADAIDSPSSADKDWPSKRKVMA
jgi:hypothetical protein